MKCPGCGVAFRKGKRRGILQEDGSIEIRLVCDACARRTFAVLRPIGGAASLCATCKKTPARVCSECASRDRVSLVAPILFTLRKMAEVAELQGDHAARTAYEHAAGALEREAEKG